MKRNIRRTVLDDEASSIVVPFENNIIKILHYYYSFVNRNKAQYLQNLFLCNKGMLNMYFLNKIERK